MSDQNKELLSRKESSDSGDETNVPKIKTSDSSRRVCPTIEEPTASEASGSAIEQLEGAVGGVGISTPGPSRPTCLSPDWNPDAIVETDAAVSPGKKKATSPIGKVLGPIKSFFKKISPKKKSPTKPVKSPKPPKPEKAPKAPKPPKPEKAPKPPKPEKLPKHPKFDSETRPIKSLPPSASGFQPCYRYNYDVKSVKSVEVTEMDDLTSEVTSMPGESLPTSPFSPLSPLSPLSKDPEEEGTPRKIRKFNFEPEDKKDDDDKGKTA